MWGYMYKRGWCNITTRFVFDASAIYCQPQGPSSLLRSELPHWRSQRPSHVVNLLKQTTPPLSENCMGNIFWAAAAHAICGQQTTLSLSSWCKYGRYDAAFGWVFTNLVILLVDTRLSDGIQAWVTLDEQEMAVLEANPGIPTLQRNSF
ncbi:hypothetical protein Peur_051494 [Populus x canadensis]